MNRMSGRGRKNQYYAIAFPLEDLSELKSLTVVDAASGNGHAVGVSNGNVQQVAPMVSVSVPPGGFGNGQQVAPMVPPNAPSGVVPPTAIPSTPGGRPMTPPPPMAEPTVPPQNPMSAQNLMYPRSSRPAWLNPSGKTDGEDKK